MSTRQTPDAEFLIMRHGIEKTAQNIKQFLSQLADERQALQEKVEAYAAKRIEFFNHALAAQGMTWCTCCSKIISEADAELLFEEGRHSYSHGYGDSFYGFRGFSKLHRACPACRQKAADRHGWKGEHDSQCNDQACYNAFQAEKHEDGFYARKFGNRVKLDKENCKFDELPPKELIEKYAEEYNLPPRITFDFDGGLCLSNRKLVIHERVPKSEAA